MEVMLFMRELVIVLKTIANTVDHTNIIENVGFIRLWRETNWLSVLVKLKVELIYTKIRKKIERNERSKLKQNN